MLLHKVLVLYLTLYFASIVCNFSIENSFLDIFKRAQVTKIFVFISNIFKFNCLEEIDVFHTQSK